LIPAAFWSRFASDDTLTVLTTLARLSRARRQPVWLCGGTLRDLLLGRLPPDVDLAAAGDALELGRVLAAEAGGRFVPLKAEMATCRVVWERVQLDLVGLRAPGIEADLAARDFTVNALAMTLGEALGPRRRLIDPTGGRADLAGGVLRPAGPGVLADDPLRVLRAFRFMSTHGFALAPGLLEELAAAAPGLFRVARERVGQEWRKLMSGAAAAPAVMAMEQAQALTRLAPELAPGRGMAQNPFHHLDVLAHNLACLAALEEVAADLPGHLGGLAPETSAYLADEGRRYRLKNAALFHDLGKPATRRDKEPGWASFHRHDLVGADLALRADRRLGLGKAESAEIARLVREHMRPFHLLGAFSRGAMSERALRRALVAAGEDLPGLFLLGLADTMAGRGPERPPEAEARLVELWGRAVVLRDRGLALALQAPPLLDGRVLMRELGLAPGPALGRLLKLVRRAQLDGRVTTPAQALELAARVMAKVAARAGSIAKG
jgi:poly(A) polymerase